VTTIDAGACLLREWRDADAAALVRIANDAEVARYLADAFPHPYTDRDAAAWLSNYCLRGVHFAIETSGELAGGIGGFRLPLERRRTMYFGYWLGKSFWGRGIAAAAAGAFTRHVFSTTDVIRMESTVYSPNVASMRVLEKCGFAREGVLRRSIIKNGEILDAVMFAKVAP
jgi:[ribosomal protein S5]-alanine N-acetyltransferase